MMRKKFHCKNCGGVYCKNCTNQSMPLLHYGILQAVKVCDTCAEILGFQSNGDRSSNNNFETSTTTNSDDIDDDDDYDDN